MLSFAWAVKTDPEHQMRKAVDRFLVDFAQDLQSDPQTIAKAEQIKHQVLVYGLVFVVAGLAFKLGVVPFHMWVPDTYTGAPVAVAASRRDRDLVHMAADQHRHGPFSACSQVLGAAGWGRTAYP